jgi:hormone-sensitive lipase
MSNTSSCENFLREIVANTDVPMISVDYSHAPEAPYPRAAEEVFYAYCWMLKNPKYCGSTCERVIIFCDSAGAHLSLYSIFKCIDNNIQLPIHFVSIYGTFCLTNDLFLSSRFLTLMDGMISVEMAETILSAYLQNNKDCDREFISWTAKDEILKKFPKSSLICGTMDPLLDENIVFAKKLNSLGVDVSLITLDKFPHLFACFHNVS